MTHHILIYDMIHHIDNSIVGIPIVQACIKCYESLNEVTNT